MNETKKDPEIIVIRSALLTDKWKSELVKPYLKVKNELREHNDVILRTERILLPKSLHQQTLKIAHEGHLGIGKCKSLLRQKVYWLSMDKNITDYVNKCVACQANIFKQTSEPIRISKLPEYPWSQISIDLYGPLPSDEILFVLMDVHSRYPIVKIMKKTSVQSVIRKLNKIFSILGVFLKMTMDHHFKVIYYNYILNFGIVHVLIV